MKELKDFIIKVLNNNIFMALLFVCIASTLCIINKFEFNWDFTNYHYYNPFAFVHNRMNYDIVPSSINTFFNPLIDLPLYFAIEYFNDNPDIVFAIQGVWFGLLLFMFYKTTTLFFDSKNTKSILLIILTVLIAATGQATYFQSGTSTNEIQVAFISFLSIYCLFKMIKYPEKQRTWKYFLSGLILGLVLGLKSTAIFICLSSGLSLIICYKYLSNPIKFIVFFAFGGLIGYLITNGWWMYRMYDLYQNPFFPFLNKYFKSPYFDDLNFSDGRFVPPLSKILIFPYIWMSGKYRTAEISFFDFRGPVFYTIAIIFMFYILIKPHRIKKLYEKNNIWFFYIVFLVTSYVLWLLIFSIYRYIIIVEMLSAIFFVKILFSYKTGSNIKLALYYSFVITLCGILLLNIKVSYGWNNLDIHKKYVYVETIKMPENTLLKLYNFPTAGVIPILAKYNNFRALGYKHINAKHMEGSDFVERGKFREIRDKFEKEHKGTIIVIYRTLAIYNPRNQIILDAIKDEIKDKYCRKLKNNLDRNMHICVPTELKNEILVDGGNDE